MTSTVYDWINIDKLEKALDDLEKATTSYEHQLACTNTIQALGGIENAPDAIRQLIRDAGIGPITINIQHSTEAHAPRQAHTIAQTRPDQED